MSTSDELIAELREAAAKATPGPWDLVWWGNERYPYPLSILADKAWIARDGTVSSEANARYIALANPDNILALLSRIFDLEQRLKEAEEVVRPFADEAERMRNYPDDYPYSIPTTPITVGDLRRARAWLTRKEDDRG